MLKLATVGLSTCTKCGDPYSPPHSDAQDREAYCSEDCETEYNYLRGRSAGAADRLLGYCSALALQSPLPGYADGYRAGRAGR